MSSARSFLACSAFSAATLVAGRATADDLRLAWEAPAGCPSSDEVRAAAMKGAGDGSSEPLEADARVEHGERWRVTIRTRRAGVPSAERQLEAASCEALADATAVILALALIPPGSAASEEPEVAPALPAPPSVAPAAREAPAEPPDRVRSPRGPYDHALAGSASLATDGTTLPSVAAGGAVSLAWTPGRARVEIGGSTFSSQSRTTGTSGAGARMTLAVVGLRACYALARGTVELSPCAGADLQLVDASGFGATRNFDAGAQWGSATGGAIVRVPLASWLALRAQLDAVVPLARPRFVVENEGSVHRPSAMGARGGIGAEILFL